MKIFNIFVLSTLFLSSSLQILSQPNMPDQPMLPGAQGQPGKMPPISEDDLNDMVKVLETLDQETLDALAKIGEEYIKEMESQGKDPFEELFGVPTPDDFKEPIESELPAPPTIEKPKEIAVPAQDCIQAKQCRELLKNVAELISSIRLKAEDDRKSSEQLKPWKYHLDDIIYFAHTLAEDKLIKYVTDKEFTKLHKAYSDLEHELSYLEPLFIVTEPSLEKVNPYTLLGTTTDSSWQDVNTAYQKIYKEKHPDAVKTELAKEGIAGPALETKLTQAQREFNELSDAYNVIMQKEQAQQALSSIIDSFSRAIYVNNIILESKKILEKYEPEALKIKEQQEELEKKARKEQEEAQRRRPQYTRPVLDPSAFDGVPGMQPTYDNSAAAPSMPSFDRPADAGKPGTQQPGQKPSEPGKPGAPKPKDEKRDGKSGDKKDEIKKGPKLESHKAQKKLDVIKKNFEAIATELDEKSPSPENYDEGKDLFKNFSVYLNTPIKDNIITDEQLKKAKGINFRLLNITNKLHDIHQPLKDDSKDLSKAEKKELQQPVKKLYDEYFGKNGSHTEKIKPLLMLTDKSKEITEDNKKYYQTTAQINSVKHNMHLKIDEKIKATLPEAMNTTINSARGKSTPDYDILNNFIDEFKKLQLRMKK